MSQRKPSRLTRQLVFRLERDLGLSWPGGEDNAALIRRSKKSDGYWRLVTVDGRRAPDIRSQHNLSGLIRSGFAAEPVESDNEQPAWVLHAIPPGMLQKLKRNRE